VDPFKVEIEDLNTKTTIISMESNLKPITFKARLDEVVTACINLNFNFVKALESVRLNPSSKGVFWWLRSGVQYPSYLLYDRLFPNWLKWSMNPLSFFARLDGLNVADVGWKSSGTLYVFASFGLIT
jgi:hypothetical protein